MRETVTMSDTIRAQVIRSRSGGHELMQINGIYRFFHHRAGKLIDFREVNNTVTAEGKQYLLDVGINNSVAGYIRKTAWYVMLVSNDGPPPLPNVAHIYDTFSGATITEFTDYGAATRRPYVGVVSPSKITNAASRASFTATAATKDVYGAALVSLDAKSDHDPAGYLMSWAGLPGGVLDIQFDDILNIEIELAFT